MLWVQTFLTRYLHRSKDREEGHRFAAYPWLVSVLCGCVILVMILLVTEVYDPSVSLVAAGLVVLLTLLAAWEDARQAQKTRHRR